MAQNFFYYFNKHFFYNLKYLASHLKKKKINFYNIFLKYFIFSVQKSGKKNELLIFDANYKPNVSM